MQDWLPRSITCFKDYSWQKLAADALAGVTVGLVALPLAMESSVGSASAASKAKGLKPNPKAIMQFGQMQGESYDPIR